MLGFFISIRLLLQMFPTQGDFDWHVPHNFQMTGVRVFGLTNYSQNKFGSIKSIVVYLWYKNHSQLKTIFMTITHYGMDIDQLSKKEQLLLKIDQTMTLLFKAKKEEMLPDFLTDGITTDLSNKRVHLTIELLNLSVDDFETKDDLLEYIETTKYSYTQFVKDCKKNCEMLEHQEQLSKWN